MKLAVLVAAAGAAWEERLVTAADRSDLGIEIARRCVDVVDLLAVAAAGQGRAAVVAAGLRRLDADAVDRLHAAGVVPVGVIRRDDQAAEERLRAMGIEYLVPEDADPQVIAALAREAVAGLRAASAPPASLGFTAPSASASFAAGPVGAAPEESNGRHAPAPRRGRVVAVWGPTGAPGRTTVAVNLADALSRVPFPTLLVDADVYGATVAAALGLLDESPGLAAACRHAASSRLDGATLAGICWQLTPNLRVLTGIPLASRWPELRPAGVQAVLSTARELADYTVVDCGFNLETDEELSYDTMAPRRNGATLAVLEEADIVVVVGAGDPIGMQRLVRSLAELRELDVVGPESSSCVVLNKVRRGVVPGDPRSELVAALARFGGTEPVALLPYDRDGLDVAVATGRTLAESRPSSPLRAALVDLASLLTGVPAPRGRGARR